MRGSLASAIGITVGLSFAAAVGSAHPGGVPASDDIALAPGDPSTLVVVATFGLLVSVDSGESFEWVCPDALPYGPGYEPHLEIADDGTMFSTSLEGLVVSHDDACSWTPIGGELDGMFTEGFGIGVGGRIWAATSAPGSGGFVFSSDDNGVSFTARTPAEDGIIWNSVVAAPSAADRVYVSGWLPPLPATSARQARILRTTNGGDGWEPLDIAAIDTGGTGNLRLLAVSPQDPDLVFARTDRGTDSAVYRSDDGGGTWAEVLVMPGPVRAFLIRRDGSSVIAGTVYSEDTTVLHQVRVSSDGGVTWSPPAQEPQMACVTERSDGTLISCGANWEPDFFMVGRSTDGMTWDPVSRAVDVAAAKDCPAGTIQNDSCEQLQWLSLCVELGLPPCAPAADAGPPESPPERGCGGCSAASPAAFLFLPLGFRRRRRRGARTCN